MQRCNCIYCVFCLYFPAQPPCIQTSIACATLRAHPNLYAFGGLLVLPQASGIHVDHIILDGNRANRLNTQAASDCATGANNRMAGFNARSTGCNGKSTLNSSNCKMDDLFTALICISSVVARRLFFHIWRQY